jgi:hypothetical protein
MNVYLVPVAERRYQLYVEVPADDAASAPADDGRDGWASRQARRFRNTLAEAEQARLRRERGEPDGHSGVWAAVLRRVAEAVAEQRLLWHLRHQTAAVIVHPDDLSRSEALTAVRAEFTGEIAKHRRWLVIDAVVVGITGPLFFFVPGPNLVSWYFTFRAIGHLLSWRGARKGLIGIAWESQPSAELTAVRSALTLPAPDRRLRLLAIGEALGLAHLAPFVERVWAGRKQG